MDEPIVTLKRGEGRTLLSGGLWVYDNEIAAIAGHFRNGSVVTVADADGAVLGRGYINQNSKIRVRLLTRSPGQAIDDAFLLRRAEDAWRYRKEVLYRPQPGPRSAEAAEILARSIGALGAGYEDLCACRIIFGEADFLPGLVVDKYADVLVVQCLTLGMEQFKERIVSLLRQVLARDGISVRGVYERSDAAERRKEGLLTAKGFLTAPFDTLVPVVENGLIYEADVENGQKTGFFLDQKYNRLAIRRVCRGARVLDCFTNIGTFALNAALAGAREVTGLDISNAALESAARNAARNGLQSVTRWQKADVVQELPKMAQGNERYDVVILDPPAFTKSRTATRGAVHGYRSINTAGLRLVRDGGYFATCSCSHFMTQELFAETIAQAAHAAHRRLRQVEFRTQSPDHPILWSAQESYYLKFYLFQCVDEK